MERFGVQWWFALLAFGTESCFRVFGFGDPLDDGTAPCAAVGADGTGTESFIHINRVNNYPSRACQQRRMIVVTEPHIDQVQFPTD